MIKGCKFIKDVILYVLVIILSIFVIISFLNSSKISKYKFYDVLTGSMSPTIKSDSLIVVKKINDIEVKKGDIITFKSRTTNNLTTHRVMEIINDKKTKFQTKGDANYALDPMFVDGDLLVGKVIAHIPYVGKLMRIISNYRIIIMVLIIVYICSNKILKTIKAT